MKFDDIRFRQFWSYVVERQAIYHRRHVLQREPPWTDDPILLKYRFTEVYREHDRGTRFVTERLLPKYLETRDTELWFFNCVVYRKFNLPRTHIYLARKLGEDAWLTDWHPTVAAKVLRDLQAGGMRFRSVAYNTAAQGHTHEERAAKIHATWLQRFWFAERLTQVNSLQEAHAIVKEVPGFGPFMAMEVVQDLNYAQRDGLVLNFSEDEWAYVGPGGVRGLNLLLGRKPTAPLKSPLDTLRALWEQQELGIAQTEKAWFGEKPISLNNLESCLCEFAKYEWYMRSGRGKRLFNASEAYLQDVVENGARRLAVSD